MIRTFREYAPIAAIALVLVLMAGVALFMGPDRRIAPEQIVAIATQSQLVKPACDEQIEVISIGMETDCDLRRPQSLVVLYMPMEECLDSGGIFIPMAESAICADVDY